MNPQILHFPGITTGTIQDLAIAILKNTAEKIPHIPLADTKALTG